MKMMMKLLGYLRDLPAILRGWRINKNAEKSVELISKHKNRIVVMIDPETEYIICGYKGALVPVRLDPHKKLIRRWSRYQDFDKRSLQIWPIVAGQVEKLVREHYREKKEVEKLIKPL